MDKQRFFPNNWKIIKLSHVVKINSGIALPSIFRYKEKYDGGEIPFYKVAQMNNHDSLMTDADLYFNADIAKRENIKIFPKGSVLLPKRGGAILTNKKRIMTIDASYDSNIMGLKADNQLLSDEFLFAFLQNLDLSNFIESSTIPQINNKHIEMMNIPLPPLNEQKRLVALLDTLFAKIDRSLELLNENITAADALLPSALNTVFWELGEKYGLIQLDKVTKYSQGIQVALSNQMENYNEGLFKFLRIINYTQNSNEFRYIKEFSEKAYVQENDIVMVRYGATAGFVGKGLTGVIANNMFRVIPNHSYLNDFIYYTLKNPKNQEILYSNIGAAAMPAINFGTMSLLQIPNIDKNIQTQTVAYLDSIREKVEILKHAQNDKIKNLKALKASLLDRAFKGEL